MPNTDPCPFSAARASVTSAGYGTISSLSSEAHVGSYNTSPRDLTAAESFGTTTASPGTCSESRAVRDANSDTGKSRSTTNVTRLGFVSTSCLVFNKMVGTGIFATPSSIFALIGAVGPCLLLWIIGQFLSFQGGLLTVSGLNVFLEFGLAIPRSGGEKNYIERVYRRPRLLSTCVLLFNAVFFSFTAGSALAFGRYTLIAMGHGDEDRWTARALAVACVALVVLIHSLLPRAGIALLNALGFFKVAVLVSIIVCGIAAHFGYKQVPDPHNFDHPFTRQSHGTLEQFAFAGYPSALLRVVYTYRGWDNANAVLGEIKDPQKTLPAASMLAAVGVMLLYALVNMAYFTAVSAAEFASPNTMIAATFFRNVFGDGAASSALLVCIIWSNLGTVLAGSFASARVIQQYAADGFMPFSGVWASNWPCGTPTAALVLHWIITSLVLTVPPAGAAYGFIIELYTYPSAWINGFVAAGLVYLRINKSERWSSPWQTSLPLMIVFLLSNVFLAIGPFLTIKDEQYTLPSYTVPIAGLAVLLLGAPYWAVCFWIGPKLHGYTALDRN